MKKQKQQLELNNKKINTVNENLTEDDFKNMMKHSSYKRVRGGVRQVR